MTLDEARAGIGRQVIYERHYREREAGVVTSVNERFVFVRYGLGSTSAATDPADLTFAVGGPS